MQRGHYRVAHFDREVAARHHDHIRGVDDFFQRGDRFGALDLRHQQRVAAGLAHQIAGPFHVGAGARKRNAEVIRLQLGGGLDVLLVFVGQRRGGQAAALAIDALVVRQRTAHFNDAVDARAFHRCHAQHDASIVE